MGTNKFFKNMHRKTFKQVSSIVTGLIIFMFGLTGPMATQAVATDVFTSSDGKAHLNLITCDGIWDKNAAQYSERLVVFADRVEK